MRTETAHAIKTLININNHRQEGYSRAAHKTSEENLRQLFTYFSDQSKSFREELVQLNEAGKAPETLTEEPGTGQWTELNEISEEADAKSVLSSCEFGEDAAKKTYDEVMEHTEELSSELYEVIASHRSALHKTHNMLRSLYFNF